MADFLNGLSDTELLQGIFIGCYGMFIMKICEWIYYPCKWLHDWLSSMFPTSIDRK